MYVHTYVCMYVSHVCIREVCVCSTEPAVHGTTYLSYVWPVVMGLYFSKMVTFILLTVFWYAVVLVHI